MCTENIWGFAHSAWSWRPLHYRCSGGLTPQFCVNIRNIRKPNPFICQTSKALEVPIEREQWYDARSYVLMTTTKRAEVLGSQVSKWNECFHCMHFEKTAHWNPQRHTHDSLNLSLMKIDALQGKEGARPALSPYTSSPYTPAIKEVCRRCWNEICHRKALNYCQDVTLPSQPLAHWKTCVKKVYYCGGHVALGIHNPHH